MRKTGRSEVGGRGSRVQRAKLSTPDSRSPTPQIVELAKDFRFEAAHYLPNVAEGHKCRRMHGHSFRGEVVIRGPLDPRTGWLIDFADLKRAVDPLVQRLDHYLLNEVEGLENPTSERIAIWLWERLAPPLPQLYCVTVEETCTTRCRYFGGREPGAGGRKQR